MVLFQNILRAVINLSQHIGLSQEDHTFCKKCLTQYYKLIIINFYIT